MSALPEINVKSELVWKALSASLIPALIWVNSISNDVAVLKSRISQAESSINAMTTELSEVSKTTTQNATKLEAIQQSLRVLHQSLSDTRQDLRILNTRLLGYTQPDRQ